MTTWMMSCSVFQNCVHSSNFKKNKHYEFTSIGLIKMPHVHKEIILFSVEQTV